MPKKMRLLSFIESRDQFLFTIAYGSRWRPGGGGEGFLDPWFLYSFLRCQPKFGKMAHLKISLTPPKIVRDSFSAIHSYIIFLSFLASHTIWMLQLAFSGLSQSLGTMLPVCYPACTLVEAFTVLWISVKPRGFPTAKVLVIWKRSIKMLCILCKMQNSH